MRAEDPQGDWLESLGEAAREALADQESARDRDLARIALHALHEALGEDEASAEIDPGLPADYEVMDVLGRGAFGVVYRAHQQSLDRQVAVKVLHPGGSPRDVERLLGEARRLASLSHPSIVKVHDVGRAHSGVYMTMELQVGGSLQKRLAQAPCIPAQAARITRQVADALAYTHARGVVHLDLKPANVLLDEAGEARVADFGLAREVARTEHSGTSGGLLGTPSFMAPEQAADRRDQLGERTDVYGLGAMLYACLTGFPPHSRDSLLATLRAVQEEEPVDLRTAAPGTPSDLVAVVSKAMSKDPEERYATAQEMSLDLGRFEAGEPVLARLPSLAVRVRRLLRAHTREVASAGLASVATLLTLVPFYSGRSVREETLLKAANELIVAGETRAARLLLEESGLTPEKPDEGRPANPLEEPQRTRFEERMGWARGDASWVGGLLGEEWLGIPGGWIRTPLEIDRAWNELMEGLAERWSELPEAERARFLALVQDAPVWTWMGITPPGSTELLELSLNLWRVHPVPAEEYGLLVDVFLVDDRGRTAPIASHLRQAKLGEPVRIEGQGASGWRVPFAAVGLDFLGALPFRGGKSKQGGVSYELCGQFQRRSGGVAWNADDQETDLGIRGHDGAWFLDCFGGEVALGQASVVEAHQYLWGGNRRVSILMLAEASEDIELLRGLQGKRTLEDWSHRFASGLAGYSELPFDAGEWSDLPPLQRSHFLLDVLSLAVVHPGRPLPPLDRIAERMRVAGIEPASLSEGFTRRAEGSYTGVTRAGADVSLWLDWARDPLPDTVANVSATLARLPLPGSAESGSRKRQWTTWLFTGYFLAALVILWGALRHEPRSPQRQVALAWGMLLAALTLDKTAPLALGFFWWDPYSLALMALMAWLLPVVPSLWSRGLALGLALTAVQACFPEVLGTTRWAFGGAVVCGAFLTRHLLGGQLAWLPALTLVGLTPGLASAAFLEPDYVQTSGFGRASYVMALLVVLGNLILLGLAASKQQQEGTGQASVSS